MAAHLGTRVNLLPPKAGSGVILRPFVCRLAAASPRACAAPGPSSDGAARRGTPRSHLVYRLPVLSK